MAKLPRMAVSLFDTSEIPVESKLLSDLDYVVRQLNKKLPHYFYRSVESGDPVLDATGKQVDIICVDELPEASESNLGHIYHINDKGYFVCEVSDGKPSRTYKPSSLKCMRQMYFQIVGADLDKNSTNTSSFYGICESGTDRHMRIQSYFMSAKDFGIDLEYIKVSDYVKENNLTYLKVISETGYETKLHDDSRNITFMCDGIIKYQGKVYILEIKTESTNKFIDRTYVDSSHLYQAYTYSMEFGIKDVIFLYENRDLCAKKTYKVHVSNENIEFIENRLKTCDSYVEKNEVPPIEDTITKRICQYCDYKTVCKAAIVSAKT